MINGAPFTVEKISPRAGLELGTARSVLAGDQWWPFFVTFLFLVTDILCLVIQYFGKIN